MTSHSGELIAPLPEASIRFLKRDNNGVKLVSDAPSPALLETIGLRAPVDILAFVEDEAAVNFSKLWVETHEPYLTRRMKIVPKNGDGAIVNILRALNTDYGEITILGIFDGDARQTVPKEILEKALFLPGDQPIERLFKEMVHSEPNKLREALGGRDISDTLFVLQGSDHHDWFLGLSEHLGLHPGQLFMLLYSIWTQSDQNRNAAKTAFDALRAKLNDVDNVEAEIIVEDAA